MGQERNAASSKDAENGNFVVAWTKLCGLKNKNFVAWKVKTLWPERFTFWEHSGASHQNWLMRKNGCKRGPDLTPSAPIRSGLTAYLDRLPHDRCRDQLTQGCTKKPCTHEHILPRLLNFQIRGQKPPTQLPVHPPVWLYTYGLSWWFIGVGVLRIWGILIGRSGWRLEASG